jgi:hypothetical protein
VKAGAAKAILLNQPHVESELGRPDGGDVPAGARAQDDDVEAVSQLREYPSAGSF